MYHGVGVEFFEQEAFRLGAWRTKVELSKQELPVEIVRYFEKTLENAFPRGIPDMLIKTKFGDIFTIGWHE